MATARCLLVVSLILLTSCDGSPNQSKSVLLPELTVEYLQTQGGQARPASDYIRHEVTEIYPSPGAETIFFNSAQREKLLQVRLVGEQIVFAPDEDGHLLNSYHGDGNLQSLVIEARHVVIRAPLHLPGTDVQIYANTIEFIDDVENSPASINTSPLPMNLPEAADATRAADGGLGSPAEDGMDGESAGDLYLIVRELIAPGIRTPKASIGQLQAPATLSVFLGSETEYTKRFIMVGGDGQAGGKGLDADVGQSLYAGKSHGLPKTVALYKRIQSDIVKAKQERKRLRDPFSGLAYELFAKKPDAQSIYAEAKPKIIQALRKEKAHFDKTKNAIPGGRPGNGGAAGEFGATFLRHLLSLVDRRGGEAGGPTAPTAGVRPNTNTFKYPRLFVLTRAAARPWSLPKPGRNAKSQTGNPGSVAEPVSLDYLGNDAWATAAMLQVALERLEDLYLIGDLEQASVLAVDLLNWTSGVKHDEASEDYAWEINLSHLINLSERMLDSLDFFGNPPGWVPNLSLQVNYKIYQQEIKNQVQSMFLSQWLERYWKHQAARRDVLERLIATQQLNIEYQREVLTEMRVLITEAKRKSESIDADIRAFTQNLEARINEIKKTFDAKREKERILDAIFAGFDSALSIGFLTSMLTGSGGGDSPDKKPGAGTSKRSKGLGVAGKAAGMLALSGGVAGAVENFNSSKPAEISGSEGSQQFRAIFEEEEIAQAKQELAELGINDFGGIERYHQRITGIADVVSKELREVMRQNIYASLENSPDYEGALELQGLLEADSSYQTLFNDLVKLATRRQIYVDELVYANNSLDNATNSIMEATWTIENIEMSLNEDQPSPALKDSIAQIRRRAEQRLTEYQYYLAKSYEYAVLEPAQVNFHNNQMFRELQKLFDNDSTQDDSFAKAPLGVEADRLHNQLSAVYAETLKQMTSRIINGLNSERFSPLAPQNYSIELSPGQLETLRTYGQLEIDLKLFGVLSPSDKNVRVLSMKIDPEKSQITLKHDPIQGARPAIDFVIGPNEHSFIPWGDQAIGFNHREPQYSSILFWHDVWQYPDGFSRSDSVTKNASDSLIANLLDDASNLSQLHFKPSAHGTFTIYMENLSLNATPMLNRIVIDIKIEKNKKIEA
jgi:hypothetical protein